MRYLFKSTYTDENPDTDRVRKSTVVEAPRQADAITIALSKLEMHAMAVDAVMEYTDTVENVDEGHEWIAHSNNGQYHFEIEPFEAGDPVTKQTVIEWAEFMLLETNRAIAREAGYPDTPNTAEQILVNVLGRWYYQMISEWPQFDLKDQLHTIILEGMKCKPYEQMTLDELAETVIAEIVDGVRDNYNEIEQGRPFGMTAMVHDDEYVWFNQGQGRT